MSHVTDNHLLASDSLDRETFADNATTNELVKSYRGMIARFKTDTLLHDEGEGAALLNLMILYRENSLLRYVRPVSVNSKLFLPLLPSYLMVDPDKYMRGFSSDTDVNSKAAFIAYVMGLTSDDYDGYNDAAATVNDITTEDELYDLFHIVDADFPNNYITIDGDTVLDIAVFLDRRNIVLQLMKLFPDLIMRYNENTRMNFLYHLSTMCRPSMMARIIAQYFNVMLFGAEDNTSKTMQSSIMVAIVHDILTNDGKGVEELSKEGFNTTLTFKMITRSMLFDTAKALSLFDKENYMNDFLATHAV